LSSPVLSSYSGFIIIIKLTKETRWRAWRGRDYCRDGGTMEMERLEREDVKELYFV
jgi:hypothetical protein